MPQFDAVTAFRRFGLGPKPGDITKVANDPRGFLASCLADKTAARIDNPELQPSYAVFAMAQEAQLAQRLANILMKEAAQPATTAASPPPDMRPASAVKVQIPNATANQIRRDVLNDELAARIERGISTDKPLLERLVLFWSNHFCVSSAKGNVRSLAGGFEREAIRPHVLGRFADMLLAVEQHPAMLIYLDNQGSIGPNSKAGRNRTRGLNENLARETLELHTLGVSGGYTQEDVTNLARLYTGWTVGVANIERSEPGKFFFAEARHEPGQFSLVGKRYGNEGRQSAQKAPIGPRAASVDGQKHRNPACATLHFGDSPAQARLRA